MTKLLVNTPSGAQDVLEVSEGGGYFDQSRVLWDERIDGPLPAITLGGMVRADDGLSFDQTRLDAHAVAAARLLVPKAVSTRQAHEALIDAGLDTAIEDYIAAIANPGQRKKASNWYLRSQTFERNNRFLLSVVTALGWTDEQVDALFVAAASL